MKRNIYPQTNGDIELGDYPARMDPAWTNVVWVACHACNQRCPYCVGYSNRGPAVSLLSKHETSAVLDGFERLANDNGQRLYVTISGGEPTLIDELPEFCRRLGEMGHKAELQTNLLDADRFSKFIDEVHPKYVGQIMATYHGWRLDKNDELRGVWMRNFAKAWGIGHTIVLKTVVLPDEVEDFPKKKAWLQSLLPDSAPILPWVYLHGMPRSLEDFTGAYPFSYTSEQQTILDRETQHRSETQRWYRAGSGFYRGMRCDGGRGFLYLDVGGDVYRCFNAAQMKPVRSQCIGNMMTDSIGMHDTPRPCPIHFCSTGFWPLWYGENPWLFVPGGTKERATFCKFGPNKKERGT